MKFYFYPVSISTNNIYPIGAIPLRKLPNELLSINIIVYAIG